MERVVIVVLEVLLAVPIGTRSALSTEPSSLSWSFGLSSRSCSRSCCSSWCSTWWYWRQAHAMRKPHLEVVIDELELVELLLLVELVLLVVLLVVLLELVLLVLVVVVVVELLVAVKLLEVAVLEEDVLVVIVAVLEVDAVMLLLPRHDRRANESNVGTMFINFIAAITMLFRLF